MGIHFGIIAAKTPLPGFLVSLSQSFGKFVDRGAVRDVASPPFTRGEDGVIIGEHQGASFLLDQSMVLSADYDKLLELSRLTNSLIVACLGETVSGSFALFAARDGQLIRLYSHCESATTKPFEVGAPLPCESQIPLHEIDGAGLFAAIRYFQMDFDGWYKSAAKHAYIWELDNEALAKLSSKPADGSLIKSLNDHFVQFAIPKDQRLKPKVVSRRMPDGSTGYDIVSKPPSRPADGPHQTESSPPAPQSIFSKLRSFLGMK